MKKFVVQFRDLYLGLAIHLPLLDPHSEHFTDNGDGICRMGMQLFSNTNSPSLKPSHKQANISIVQECSWILSDICHLQRHYHETLMISLSASLDQPWLTIHQYECEPCYSDWYRQILCFELVPKIQHLPSQKHHVIQRNRVNIVLSQDWILLFCFSHKSNDFLHSNEALPQEDFYIFFRSLRALAFVDVKSSSCWRSSAIARSASSAFGFAAGF